MCDRAREKVGLKYVDALRLNYCNFRVPGVSNIMA
jgi:hypothetical protein